MRKLKTLAALLAVCLLLLGAAGAFALRAARRLSVSTPDLSAAADGCYIGQAAVLPVRVRVEVDVYDHRLAAIRILEHDCGRGAPAEALVQAVLERQTLELDAVSGATVSSKCLLKAIENALTEGGPV